MSAPITLGAYQRRSIWRASRRPPSAYPTSPKKTTRRRLRLRPPAASHWISPATVPTPQLPPSRNRSLPVRSRTPLCTPQATPSHSAATRSEQQAPPNAGWARRPSAAVMSGTTTTTTRSRISLRLLLMSPSQRTRPNAGVPPEALSSRRLRPPHLRASPSLSRLC